MLLTVQEEHIGDTNKTGSRGLTEEQFEAVLHVLDLRIRRSEASFHPFSAAGDRWCMSSPSNCQHAVRESPHDC